MTEKRKTGRATEQELVTQNRLASVAVVESRFWRHLATDEVYAQQGVAMASDGSGWVVIYGKTESGDPMFTRPLGEFLAKFVPTGDE